ncbi:bidirectional sugar transporter N3-like [Olea europaea subsp. europaea]|uniref:Bidirectional sugar transporter SWEET n=1 Tax=Olea europaea subsp. europaea TaxID=158383 RepID=A0A8S0U5Z6_OLEEU|nr:bidirectional sugar transporter N3-like [Olea europaea subsp. europaea]
MAVFDLHHPLMFAFGILGNIISIGVYLAPAPTFKKICKEKSTMGFECLPYIVALFSSTLWLYYAFLKGDALLLISINSFGFAIETVYITLYLVYASKNIRYNTIKLLSLLDVAVFAIIFLLSYFIFDGNIRVNVVGWICVAVSVCVFAAPLSIQFQVVRTRSVEFMPFFLSFFLTLSAVMWFAYGVLQKDLCIALPNVLGFALGLVQMLLYGIYRKSKPVVIEEKKLPEHVMNIKFLGTPEVHPVDSKTCENFEDKKEKKDEEICAINLEMEPCSPLKVQKDAPTLIVCAA